MRTIFDQLRAHFRFAPAKPAIMLPDSFVTYGMLESGIASVQSVIADLAPDRSKPVGVLIDNPARHIIVVLALLRSGFAFAAVRAEQVGYAVQLGVNLLITDQRIPVRPDLRIAFVDQQWFTKPASAASVHTHLPPDQVARVIFTSGSTGIPKAIAHTFPALNARMFDYYLAGMASQPRTMTMLGISAAGLAPALRALSSGNTIVFSPAETALQTMATFHVTELRATAVQMRGFLEQQKQMGYALDLRVLGPGGGQLSIELGLELEQVFKAQIINTYTSTEAGDMALAAGEVLKARPEKGNCFAPLAHVEIADDAGRPLPAGEEGRIRVRSHAMGWPFAGAIIQTDEVKGDGWFYPGDVGRIDADGLLVVTGRVDEVINAGGVKFSPEVMEDHLKRHPKLTDVGVVRMPGISGAPAPWLAIVSDTQVEAHEIHDWLARNASGELRFVEFEQIRRVREIPRTGNAKVARNELRTLLKNAP